MPRTLLGRHGSLKFTNIQYGLAMKLVYDMGWKPAGTLPPLSYESDEPPLDEHGVPLRWPKMNYFAAAGQRVSDADAAALSAKLRDLMLDIPNHDATLHKTSQFLSLPHLGELRVLKHGMKVNAFEFFSGGNKIVLERFADFAAKGGFAIT